MNNDYHRPRSARKVCWMNLCYGGYIETSDEEEDRDQVELKRAVEPVREVLVKSDDSDDTRASGVDVSEVLCPMDEFYSDEDDSKNVTLFIDDEIQLQLQLQTSTEYSGTDYSRNEVIKNLIAGVMGHVCFEGNGTFSKNLGGSTTFVISCSTQLAKKWVDPGTWNAINRRLRPYARVAFIRKLRK